MIDRHWIGHELPEVQFEIERARLRFFAKAVGETNRIYLEEQAARDAGHPDLPAPPTFLFSAEMDSDLKIRWLAEVGVPIGRILHGEQSFAYHRLAYAGERVSVRSRITDIYDKKGGQLEFVVFDTRFLDQSKKPISESRGIVVVRNA